MKITIYVECQIFHPEYSLRSAYGEENTHTHDYNITVLIIHSIYNGGMEDKFIYSSMVIGSNGLRIYSR